MSNNKLYSINILRFIAASFVLLSHIENKVHQYNILSLEWYRFRGPGVDIFFVMSGFIICLTTAKKNITPIKFLKGRMQRILPLYWFFTTVALCIFLYNPELVNMSGGYTNIIASYLLIPGEHKFLVQNGWTLSYDVYFYIIFALSLYFFRNKINYIALIAVLTFLPAVGILVLNLDKVFFFNVILLEYALGICAYLIYIECNLNFMLNIILILLGTAFIFFQNIFNVFETGFGRALDRGVPAFLCVVGVIGLESFFKNHYHKFINILDRLGNTSYSIYLSHPFILVIGTKLYISYYFFQNLNFALFLYVICIFIGYYVNKFIEVPLNRTVKNSFKSNSIWILKIKIFIQNLRNI